MNTPSSAAAGSSPGARLLLPFPKGQKWFVCQGYGGEISHEGVPALDLSVAHDSAGPQGCMASTKYSSAGSVVTSPGSGIAYRTSGCCGRDFVCINLDAGGSVALGHLSDRIWSGAKVDAGDRVGIVAWPDYANGDYAHIHIQAHSGFGCMGNGEAVPFDRAHGFKFRCVRELPYSGDVNQYSGLPLQHCSPDPGPRRVREPGPRFTRAMRVAWTATMLLRGMTWVREAVTEWMDAALDAWAGARR